MSESGDIPLHDLLGLDFAFEAGSTEATVRMPVAPVAFGFTGTLHGGAIATMVDLACALASVQSRDFDPTTESLVTADMHIRYLGRPRTDTVVATASVVKSGSQLIVVDCSVADDDGHLIAGADFSMMVVPLRSPLLPDGEGDPTKPEL